MSPSRATRQGDKGKPAGVALWRKTVKALELQGVFAEVVEWRTDRLRLQDEQARAKDRPFGASLTNLTDGVSDSGAVFRFVLDLSWPRGNEIEPIIKLHLEYIAVYSAEVGAELTEQTLERYRDTVAVTHALPFIRAHVQDLTGRGGLPPMVIPLLKVNSPSAAA